MIFSLLGKEHIVFTKKKDYEKIMGNHTHVYS